MAENAYPTLAEIKAQHAPKVEYERYLFASRYVFRPPSFPAIWLLVRLGLTGEGASWLSGLSAMLGLAGLVLGLPWQGAVLLCFFNFFDCLDGGIARALKARNPYGRFLDSLMSWADMLFWPALGLLVWRFPEYGAFGEALGWDPLTWPLAGALSAFFASYSGYLDGAFDEILRPYWEKLGPAPSGAAPSGPLAGKRGPELIARIAVSNLRVRETHYLLLFPAFWLGLADLLIAFFLAFNALFAGALVLVYCRRGLAVRAAGLGAETPKK